MKNNNRNSSIECLKIIAMLLIVISHMAQSYDTLYSGVLKFANLNTKIIAMQILRSLGMLGNDIFFICTSWFLVDSKKIDKKKIMEMIVDVWIVNVVFLLIFKIGKINVSKKDMIKTFFPNTLSLNWYITCYIIFYIVHPYINKMIEQISKKELLFISLFMFILYCVANTIKGEIFFISDLIVFITIYTCIAYIKKYMPKIIKNKKTNTIIVIATILTYIIVVFLLNILGIRIAFLRNKMLHFIKNENPLFITLAFSMFNLFRNDNFTNKKINDLSKLTLYIYNS